MTYLAYGKGQKLLLPIIVNNSYNTAGLKKLKEHLIFDKYTNVLHNFN